MRYTTEKRNGEYAHFIVEEPSTLLDFLFSHVRESRTKVKATLQGRGVKVDGKTVSQFDMPLSKGQKVTVSMSKRNEQRFRSRYIKIIYEDSRLIVIEKAAGILSVAGGHASLNVKSVLDDYFLHTRQRCTAHVVHRLDRDTSGLMIYAKDIDTEQIFEHYWHDIVYDRRYVAVVRGEVERDEGTITSWLKDNKAYVTYSSPTDNGGKFAVTHWRVLKRRVDYTLVEFRLETGRKNQIRVHAADMGHPVAGDVKYGGGDNNPARRLCLHAYRLCFYHPVSQEPMEFETPLPAAFRRLFK